MRPRVPAAAAAGAVLLLMTGLALREGVRATARLEWPYDADLYRDIAQAQTAADGGWLEDPFYLGERAWYNPLLAWTSALVAKVAALPAHVAHTRAGAYLGLIGPLAFFALLKGLGGPWLALLGTFHLIFLAVHAPVLEAHPWAVPTYSPWVYASVFAQGFFYLAILAYGRFAREPTRANALLVGGLGGLTFLAHAAPALILALLVAVDQAGAFRSARSKLRRLAAWAAPAALCVAAPFLWCVAWHYRLAIRNPTPLAWSWGPAGIGEGLAFFLLRQSSWSTLFAAAGLVATLREGPEGARLPRRWLAVSIVLFAYGFLGQRWPGLAAHRLELIPHHHFWFYVKAAESAFFGWGVLAAAAGLGRASSRAARALGRPDVSIERMARSHAPVAIATLALLLPLSYSRFRDREYFQVGRRQAAAGMRPERSEAVRWIRAHTRREEVFLTSDEAGLQLVGVAGRKSVAVGPFFSNPYVDRERRASARRLMLTRLRSGQYEDFEATARPFGVRYVAVSRAHGPALTDEARAALEKKFENGEFAVFATRPGAAP
jgi:hypothetical protein